MASTSKTTKDHDEIRQWAEERGGKPSHVAKTGSTADIGILRIEFPGATGAKDANLEEIGWDQFFEKFDERGLALLYQEETAGGEKSNFNKLVSSETAAEAEETGHAGTNRKAASKRAATRSRSGVSAKKTGTAKKTAAKKTAAKRRSASRPLAKTAGKKAAKTATRGTSTRKAAGRKAAQRAAGRRPTTKKAAARKRR